MQNVSTADQKWMSWLGRLVFCTERAKKLQQMALSTADSPIPQGQKADDLHTDPRPEMMSIVKREVLLQTQEMQPTEGTTVWLEQV